MSLPWLIQREPKIKPFEERIAKKDSEIKDHWLLRLPKIEEPTINNTHEKEAAPPEEQVFEEPRPTAESILQEAMESAEQTRAALQKDVASMARSLLRLSEAQPVIQPPPADYVVSLSLLIVREILGRELQQSPTPLIALLQDTLQQAPTERLQVRGNVFTIELLQRTAPDLVSQGLALVTDPSLQDYDLIVESPSQAMAYQPMQQLEALREKLRALFAQGGL